MEQHVEPVQYLRALRQWWWVIVASVVVGVVLAVVVVPTSSTEYTATQTLLSLPTTDQNTSIPTLDQMAFLATRGEVPRLAAAKLAVNPASLVGKVTATADTVAGTLTIVATGGAPRETARVADAYANSLVKSIDDKAKSQFDSAVKAQQARVADVAAAIASLPAGPAGDVQRENLTQSLASETQSLSSLQGQGPATSGLQSVESAAATASGSGTSRKMRALIAAAVGLLIGTGLALLLTRFDTRLHSREAADEAFGYPIIGEIPILSRSESRKGPVVVHNDPDSPTAEAYRSLRSTLLLAPRSRRPAGELGANGALRWAAERTTDDHAHAIMVVSPGVGEGKSSCVANLAAAFGESGKRVIVLSCDLRRPAIDSYLAAPADAPGVTEVLADGKDLEAVVCATDVPGVQIVPSGRPIGNPGELLTHGEELLGAARLLADVVIVDTPPVLATDDMSAMIPLVDDVVIVCRSGSTGAEAARRSADRLNRLGAPIAGVVLVGAQSLPVVRGYYRAYVSKGAVHDARARNVPMDDPRDGDEADTADGTALPPESPPRGT
jgi:capsular exopolysaccharide synthesis family protein